MKSNPIADTKKNEIQQTEFSIQIKTNDKKRLAKDNFYSSESLSSSEDSPKSSTSFENFSTSSNDADNEANLSISDSNKDKTPEKHLIYSKFNYIASIHDFLKIPPYYFYL